MNDTSGPGSQAPFAYFDPESSCLKMSQLTFLSDSMSSLVTLPRSGSMRNGQLFERPTLARVMGATACSSLPPIEIPYAAGLVDGEGCLHLTQSGKGRGAWTAKVTVNMTVGAKPLLEAMQATFGGGLCRLREATETWQEVWLWSLTKKPELKRFLTDIRPYLRLKGPQADALLGFLSKVEAAPRNPNGSAKWDEALKNMGSEVKERMTRLNASGAAANSLLPTPVAQDDQKQPEAHLAKKVASGAGEVITSLTVMHRQFVRGGVWSNRLLPTPAARDHKGQSLPTLWGGAALPDVTRLLPTPGVSGGGSGAKHDR